MSAGSVLRGADDITAIDADYVRPFMAAVHLVEHRGRVALVDTGTTHSVANVLAALESLGHGVDDVDYVILTHVHLDHAGGAGEFMRRFPRAQLLVHPRGAAHMIDPARLVEASIAVYGPEAFARLYGAIPPIDAARVRTLADGERVSLAGRELESWHTPGHAMHHQAIVDHASRTIFTGDTFGISYREFDTARGPFIFPTTTPTQFDPEQLVNSVRRIAAYRPQAVHLTHYARVADVSRLAADLESCIAAFVALADRPDALEPRMREFLLSRLRDHGCPLPEARLGELLGPDIGLNSDGLRAWLARRTRH